MRYFNNSLIFYLCALVMIFGLSFPGNASAKNDLYHEISTIYPSLEDVEYGPEDTAEIYKIVLYELTQSYSHQADLIRFYKSRDYSSVWVENGDLTEKAENILRTLDNSWTHGFNPNNYDVNDLYQLKNHDNWLASPLIQVLFDLGLSNAIATYVKDLSGGRSDFKNIHIDSSHWREPADPVRVLTDLTVETDHRAVFERLYPNNVLYQELRYALIKNVRQLTPYDSKTRRSSNTEKNERFVIPPSSSHSLIPHIRKDLVSMSGYDGSVSSSTHYDSHLQHLVKDFQRRHNIIEDGIIGPQTLGLLQKDRLAKVDQIIANLERLRWINFERPNKYIVVNVPSARLWAINNGQTELQMPVVVGRKERPTTSFVGEIKGVRFNPSWTIPQIIKVEDFFPKIAENPDILHEKQIQVFKGYGADAVQLDPGLVEWSALEPRDMRRFNMVQKPGDDNALGRFRFLMDNKENIYLHDTNQPDSFNRSFRAESSGCIRVSEPKALAEFVLKDNADISSEEFEALTKTLEETNVSAKSDVPVYILYLTMWFQNDGTLVYGPDIYDYDSELIHNLRHKDAIFDTENDKNRVSALTISRKNG